MEKPLVLAIETSCDETSAAVVRGVQVLSNIVSSQEQLHAKWGGIVPEAAARAHVETILPVIEEALLRAAVGLDEVEAIAVTNRPGLVGALSVGVTAAKAIAYSRRLPLIGVHHLEGHILSVLAAEPELQFPHLCLIVSGGHTELVRVSEVGRYHLIGQTIDDAAGEAFDKSSRVLGLGYPGGKAIQEAAKSGNASRYSLPRGLSGHNFDFSFSGLKTAVLRLAEKEGEAINIPDAAASVQEAIAGVLVDKAVRAAIEEGLPAITVVGGVAANERLRTLLGVECRKEGLKFAMAPIEMCTDNAAMIGIAAGFRLSAGQCDDYNLETLPNAPLP